MGQIGPPGALRRSPDTVASRFAPRLPGGPICRHEMGQYLRDLVLTAATLYSLRMGADSGSGGGVPVVVTAALWAATAAAFHSLVPVAVRLLSDSMPAIEIVFLRNLIGLLALFSYFTWRGLGTLRTAHFGLHVQRNVLNFSGMWLWFAAVGMMPLGQAVALHFTVPLMAVLLAVVILRERPSVVRWTATLVGFCGVLVILRPGVIEFGAPSLMVLGSALSYAGVSTYTRVLGRTDNPGVTTFYYQLMLAAFAAIPAFWVWQMPGLHDVPALILVAVAGTVAPYCFIRSLMLAEASIVVPFDFLRLPFTTLMAILLFGEPTNLWTWVGAAIIFFSTIVITRYEARAARAKADSD